MAWLKSLPIHLLIFFMLMFMALPSVALIIHAGLQGRQEDVRISSRATSYLLNSIADEMNNKVESSRQMMEMLSLMPEVRRRDIAAVNALLADLQRRYPVYANIMIVDREGLAWANALPSATPVSLADRKAFRDAKATGRFSAGEYVTGKTSKKPIINFAYPLKEADGGFDGAILFGIDLGGISTLLKTRDLPPGTSFGIFDHSGTFIYRTLQPDKYLGAKDNPKNFEQMKNGKEEGVVKVVSADGIERLAAYRKIRLSSDLPPYAYIRGGTPVETVLAEANAALMKNVGIMLLILVLVFALNIWLARRLIVDRIVTLQDASRDFAAGNLQVRVSEEDRGGELGGLGRTFNEMVGALSFELAERTRNEDALREKSDLLELAHDAIILLDLHGTVLYWNQGAFAMYGYGPGEAVGRNIHDLLETEPPRPLREIEEELLQEGRWEGKLRHRTVQGRRIVVSSRWVLQYDKERRPWRMMQINSDITEREKSEEELLKIQKLESLGVLAGGIAHDFNNILTGIMGNVSLAQLSLDDPERTSKMLKQAEKACHRATELSCRLLTFAKGGKPIKKTVAARHVVEEAVALVLRGSNVLSVLDIPDDLRCVEIDEGQIYQAFNNIIINALQSMPDGGTFTVSATNLSLPRHNPQCLPEGEYVKIAFSDTGCGIAPEDRKKIFDPYFTTKEGGKGLGLASAHSVIVRHGGHISLTSGPGTGTTFQVLLPASSESPAEAAEASLREPFEDFCGRRILVMDDEEVIRELITEMLGQLGCRVETCVSGGEAVERYAAARKSGARYDAVIMDLTIPGGMGGKEAARLILDLDPQARLVVSSGYSNDPVMSDYISYGFRATIAKPYRACEVAEVLEKVLQTD